MPLRVIDVLFPLVGLLTSMTWAFGQTAPTTTPTTRPTLWLIGDSTVKNGTAGQRGWGEELAPFFDESRIRVENRAIGGRSSRTFFTEGRWQSVIDALRPGDFVLIQFGHNDPAPLSGDNRERGSLSGIGEETQEVTLALGANAGKREVVQTYGWYVRRYLSDAKARGATPIVVSYVPRCPRPGQAVAVPAEPTGYALWASQVAAAEGVAFLDLNRLIWARWVADGMTPERIKAEQFTEKPDFTHTNDAGARFNAARVVEGVREVAPTLAAHLR